MKILTTLSHSPSRSLKLETDLKSQVDDYLASTLPQDLAELRSILDIAAERCEVVLHQRSTVLPELQRLQSDLGLKKPWLWWRRRAWERDAVVRERLRLVGSTVESFNSIEKLMRAIERSRASLGRYTRAEVFEVVEAYSAYADHRSSKISVDHYLVSGRAVLDEVPS